MRYPELFPSFSDDARCWIYVAERPLSSDEQRTVLDELGAFLGSWSSHGRPVRGEAEVLDDRFLIVVAELEKGEISGCGIDASVHAVHAAAERLGIRWLSPLMVFYRDGRGDVQALGRPAFRRLAASGDVTASTSVFDLSVTTLRQIRSGAFEKPASESWHARVFRLTQPAT